MKITLSLVTVSVLITLPGYFLCSQNCFLDPALERADMRAQKYQFYFLNFLFCIGVQLVENIVIVSGGQQRDSAIFLPHSPLPYSLHVTLSRVPRAIQKLLLGYPF